MSDGYQQRGVVALILDGMHPTVKAVLFGMLAIPLFFALSGMMLQINVGKLVEEALDNHSKLQRDTLKVQTETNEVMAEFLSQMEETQTDVDDLKNRVTVIRTDVDILKQWACSRDDGMCVQ